MSTEYKYYVNPNFELEHYLNASTVIEKFGLVVDAKFLPMIEYAEFKMSTACIELFCNFKDGLNDFPVRYDVAKYYIEKLRDIAYELDQNLLIYDVHKNYGYFEVEFGNYDNAVKELQLAAEIMKSLPKEKWDNGLLSDLVHYKSLL